MPFLLLLLLYVKYFTKWRLTPKKCLFIIEFHLFGCHTIWLLAAVCKCTISIICKWHYTSRLFHIKAKKKKIVPKLFSDFVIVITVVTHFSLSFKLKFDCLRYDFVLISGTLSTPLFCLLLFLLHLFVCVMHRICCFRYLSNIYSKPAHVCLFVHVCIWQPNEMCLQIYDPFWLK